MNVNDITFEELKASGDAILCDFCNKLYLGAIITTLKVIIFCQSHHPNCTSLGSPILDRFPQKINNHNVVLEKSEEFDRFQAGEYKRIIEEIKKKQDEQVKAVLSKEERARIKKWSIKQVWDTMPWERERMISGGVVSSDGLISDELD